MRNILTILLALCTAAPALANDGPCSDQVPPAQYATMAAPAYELIRLTSMDEMQQACGISGRILACALYDQPVIYMMSDNFIAQLAGDAHKGRRWKACLITHEAAHLNGWRH